MKKSYKSILLLFVVMILAMSAVSAAEIDDTSDSAVQAVDEVAVDEVASADVDDVVSTDSAADVVADPVVSTSKNFTQLKDDIASSHGYLPLASNYVRVAGEEDIEITSGVVIVGNDEYYIDANNLGGIFKITNSESIVVLNNVILKNGNSNNGGAIYNEGTLTISSSQLTNNNASFGGAIYNVGHLIINSGSALNGNTATNQGGAIYSKGTTTIETVTFENNKITTGSSYAETQTDKCNGGGAIYNEGSLTATDSTFTKNTAPHDTEIFSAGGAIYNIGASEVLVDDCTFTENSAVYSGAILFEQFSQDTVAVKNSRFNGNKAWQGGAIYGNDLVGSLIITGSNFTANAAVTPNAGQASPCGGAIMVGTKSYTGIALDVEGCNFVENNGGYMGGAIASSPDNTIKVADSNFTGNTATTLGGAIVTGTGTDLTVSGSTFTGNMVSSGMGGAIFAEPNSKNNITCSTFTNNVDSYPVAIMNYQGNLELSGNTFDDNSVYNYGGTITSQIKVTVLGNTTVSTYTDVTLNATVTDDNGNFIRDSSFNFVVDGKRIGATIDVANKIYTVTYTIPNPGIYTVGATSTKGEEYTVKNGTVKNYRGTFKDLANKTSNAQNNKLDLEYDFAYTPELGDDEYVNGIVIDKALTINGNGHTISGSNAARIFKVNAATTINNTKLVNGSTAARGGAIWSTADLTVDNCVFDGNNITTRTTSECDGGAIYADEGSKLKVYNSNFTNNIQNYELYTNIQGGAIGAIGTEVTIDNCIFTGNNGYLGGAIMVWSANKDNVVVINNSKFEDNVGYKGGAVFAQSVASLTVDNSVFNNNEVKGKHPTIDTWSSAGAVWSESSTTITNSNFTANKAEYNGGAVYIQPTPNNLNALIDNCRFINNTAGVWYGAVYYSGNGLLSVSNSYFENNDAPNAKAIGLLGGSLSLSKNTIVGDDAQILLRDEEGYYPSDVVSQINITVMDNKTHDFSFHAIKLYANITDDNGNIIKDTTFKFLVGTTHVYAKYNETTKLYEATFNPIVGEFVVNMTYTGTGTLNIKTAKISFARSLIDIQNMIDAASAGDTITLDGDYAYIPEFDSGISTILINKNLIINGNGSTIDADGASFNIFTVATGNTATLKNMVITGVNMTSTAKFGAVVNHGNLTVDNVTFKDNRINMLSNANGGAAIFNNGVALTITGSKFINNTAPWTKSTGAVSSWATSGLLIKDSYFEANVARFGGAVEIELLNQQSVAIQNCTFYNNTGYQGGALDINDGARYVNVTNCTFDDNTFQGPAGAPTTGANGAAISVGLNVAVTLEISDSIIKNNKGDNSAQSAGVGIRLADLASGIITNCTFENNIKGHGSAINIGTIKNQTATLTLKDSTFINSVGDENIMVFINPSIVASIENCTFENSAANYTIVNQGTLTLANNTISTTEAKILSKKGKIISDIKITILEGKVVTINTLEAKLNATITDDKGNLIEDSHFNFTIDDQEVQAVYNATSKLYEATYTLPVAGIYPVNITYVTDDKNLVVENATIKSIKGTFTQLKALIDAASEGSTLKLTDNFTYVPEIDGDYVNGIIINKDLTIDGNGSYISGADTARIFAIDTFATVNLNNITFKNGKALKGGAIYAAGNLTIDECEFINNTADEGEAIYVAKEYTVYVIYDEESYNALLNDPTSALNKYYAVSSTEDLDLNDPRGHSWAAVQAANLKTDVSELPWIVLNLNNFTGDITVNYNGVHVFNVGGTVWHVENKMYGIISVTNPGDCGMKQFALWGDVDKYANDEKLNISSFDAFIAGEKFTVNDVMDKSVSIKNSVFIDNGEANDYAIYNVGKLSLEKNKIDNFIYNNGTFTSTVNATLIGGQDIPAGLYDTVYPNATLTDDNGNSIFDPEFNITVAGEELTTVYDDANKVYTAEYTIKTAGDKEVSTSYTKATEVNNGNYIVDKANVTEFIVVVGGETGRILHGENATVEIILLGVNGEKLNVTDMVVIVNNNPYKVNITNGTGSFNVTELLVPGNYAALANFAGNSNYNAKYATGVFTVLSPYLEIDVNIADTTYLGDTLIEVTVSDDTFTGVVTVTIDDDEYIVPVILGEGSLPVSDKFTAGSHTYNATFAGDETYAPVQTDDKEFKVSPKYVYVDVRTNGGVNVGEQGSIKVYLEDEDGHSFVDEVELIFTNSDGVELERINITTSDNPWGPEGSVDIPFTTTWAIGMYYVTVESPNFVFMQFPDEDDEGSDDESPVTYEFVSYGDSQGTIEYGSGTVEAGEAIIFVPVTVLTNNAIDVNAADFVGMTFYVIDDPEAGEDTVYQLYKMDDNNAFVPVDIYVKISETEQGVYEFVSYGDSQGTIEYGSGTVEAGEAIIFVPVTVLTNNAIDVNAADFVGMTFYVIVDPEAGEDTVYQLYKMDDNNAIAPVDIYVKISEEEPEIWDPVTVEYPVHKYYIYDLNVKEGEGSYIYRDEHVVVIESGSYDDEFDNWNLIKINCNATVVVLRYNDEDDEFVEVDTIETKFVDGVLSVDLSDLQPGDYRLKVNISDDTYELHTSMWDDEINDDVELDYILLYGENNLFYVGEDNIYLEDVNGDGWSNYGDERIFNFTLWHSYWKDDEEIRELFVYTTTANVTVYFIERDDDGNIIAVTSIYNNETVAITDGISESINLTFLNAGEYKLTVALIDEYYHINGWDDLLKEDVEYYASYFNVDKTSVEVIVNVDNDPVTYGENATVTITINTPTGEKLNETVEVNGLPGISEVTLVNGTVTFEVPDLDVNQYTIWVNFDGTDNYWGSYNNIAVFNVIKADSKVTINPVDPVVYGNDVEISYTVENETSLDIAVKDASGASVDYSIVDGKVVIAKPNAGTYTINITNINTNNINEASDEKTFTVNPAAAEFTAEVVATPVAYPGVVQVKVNASVAGKVSVYINNEVYKEFDVEDGVTTLDIDGLPVGVYANGNMVHFKADNYNSEEVSITFEVTKGTPEFNVTAVVAKDTYPGAVTIIVTSDINAKFNVTVGDETKEVEVTNGIGYETFTGVAADIDNATVTFIEDTHYKETSKVEKFTAIAKSAPEFSVTPVLIVDTYKGKVNITITGVDGTYSIQINDVGTNALPIRGEIIVSGGKGSKVFENLTAGDKEVTATIDESANYTAGEGFATFTVKKATIEIEPKATGEFIVDGKINVTFKLPTDIDGTVIVYVDGVADPQAPTSVEGVYTIEFDAFNAGSHTFVATLTGDSNYADAMGQTTFDVEKVNVTISIAPDNSVPNPESILIKVADNATGTILVEIPGYLTLQKYEIENGTYTLDLGPIPADDYEIFVTYMGDDKYNNASANATFTIVKLASPEVIVNITDTAIVGEKDVVVNITVGDNFANPGNVTVYVDGIPVQTVAIDEYGNATVTVPALENGTHTIGVKYNGNNYFNASDIVNKTVTVTKAASSVTIDPIDNVTYGNTVVIKYTIVNETDYVTVLVTDESGKSYERTVEDGVITVEGIIPAGKYTVSIHNGESGFYTESEANATFYVTEGPKIDIKVAENTTAPTFNITLPEDATGYVLVDVDGKQYYAPLVNGSATIQTEPLAGGNHTVNVTYTGDSKYPGFSNSTNVTIDSNITADSAFDIPTSTETSSPTFSINLPSDATGYLTVEVDGKKYAAVVENGTASITVPGLSEGNHNVTVSYTGDGKYPALSKDATVNVHIPVYKITENKNINVLYSASASYKVLITKDGKAVGAGETVTIKYNGKTYNVKTDSKGYATLKLSTKVKVKSYTITATYQGVSVKNTVKIKHVIKASNKKVKKSRKVTKIKITLRKVNNKYLAKKTIKVKFKGKTYKVKTNKKGVATWKVKKSMVKKLKVGKKYKYRVTYGKDVLTKKLTIKR